jgi:hypothetical protein
VLCCAVLCGIDGDGDALLHRIQVEAEAEAEAMNAGFVHNQAKSAPRKGREGIRV